MAQLKAPFPYFGGKAKAASIVWSRLGDVGSYVEPFFGSGAVLLGRPIPDSKHRVETINDSNGLLTNFWRAVKNAPADVAFYADGAENEIDLRARHAYILNTERLLEDPDWFCAKTAGWWVWIQSANAVPRGLFTSSASLVARGHRSNGVCTARRRKDLLYVMETLSGRLRHVKVRHGDWRRCVQSKSMMGQADRPPFGVFLDPPYKGTDANYCTDSDVEEDVWQWATGEGAEAGYRICVAGYDDGRVPPDGWETVHWTASGGHGNKSSGGTNAKKERLWFSPACLKAGE